MIAFQRAGQAFKARSGTAILMRALPTAPFAYYIQYCAMHDKAAEVTEVNKKAGPATKATEISVQQNANRITSATKTKATSKAVEKPSDLSRDEFWRKVPIWKDVSSESFMSYRWSVC